jgi:hypothetical protein
MGITRLERVRVKNFHFSMAIFLHDLMASIAVQCLLAELLGGW